MPAEDPNYITTEGKLTNLSHGVKKHFGEFRFQTTLLHNSIDTQLTKLVDCSYKFGRCVQQGSSVGDVYEKVLRKRKLFLHSL